MAWVNKKVFLGLLLILAVLSLAHFVWASYNTLVIGFADINVFLYRVWVYLKTGELYLNSEDLPVAYEAGRSVLKFPPLYVVPYVPWIDANMGINHHIHIALFVLHVLRYVIAFALCGTFLGPRRDARWWMSLTILFSLCAPFYEALYGLTFDNFFLFTLVVSLILMKSKRLFFPAMLLTFAASAKIYPILQLIPALLSRNRRMIAYCVLGLLLWPVMSLLVFGAEAHRFYFFKILPILLQEDTLCETGNLSLAALLCSHAAAFKILKLVFTAATLAIALYALRRQQESFERTSWVFSLFICLPLLVMQNVWGNYQVILLVPMCLLLSYSFRHTGRYAWLPGLFAVLAWLPLLASDNYPSMHMPYYTLVDGKITRFLIDDLKPFSALLLWTVLAVLLLQKNNHHA